jgi:hypothetical protein
VLEQLCPPELVSELLKRGHAWGKRERSLNQLLVVYYVIALSLFRRLNLAAVLGHLAEVGTHAIVDAVFAPCRVAEQQLAPLLLKRAV